MRISLFFFVSRTFCELCLFFLQKWMIGMKIMKKRVQNLLTTLENHHIREQCLESQRKIACLYDMGWRYWNTLFTFYEVYFNRLDSAPHIDMSYTFNRSSLIHFPCIGVAPPWLVSPKSWSKLPATWLVKMEQLQYRQSGSSLIYKFNDVIYGKLKISIKQAYGAH